MIPESPDAELKLDIARAYLDLREPEAAAEILREVIVEGGSRQQQEAGEILSFIA
jgi:FimV-like protein